MANEEGYEVDFLPVGEGECSGDAIAVRWREGDAFKTMIYDGGTQASGDALVEHFKKYFGTTRVDYVVNSHPDADHASGLSVVLSELEVGEVWIHQPWKHSGLISSYFHDGRITDNSLAERLKTKMSCAFQVYQLAEKNDKVRVYEPYQGCRIGPFTVLSPEKQWYIHDLIQAFEKSPEQKKPITEKFPLFKAAIDSAKRLLERWDVETLKEQVETSAENESSVILYGSFA